MACSDNFSDAAAEDATRDAALGASPAPAANGAAESAELRELGDIIRAYSAVTAELQQSHELLQSQVLALTGELHRKNQELSETVTQVSSLKNYLAGIIKSSADGIVAIDRNSNIMAWNPAANVLARLGGEIPDAPEGRPVQEVLKGPCRDFALMLLRSMQEDRAFSGVEMRLTDAGGRVRHFSASASPVWNEEEDGVRRKVGAVQIFSELTEIRELEERANRHDRLAALGEMAAGVAHEIRNPLGGIELYASTLRRKFPEDSAENATCRKIIAAATSLNRIVTDMLTFTRSRPPAFRRVPPGQVARGAVDLAARELEQKGIGVTVNIAEQPAAWRLDPDQMAQAGLNVVLNAVQAMEAGGKLAVSVREEPDADAGSVLALSFADTGPGIPDDVKGKVFDPFFTRRKDGTGLGMAIVHKIIRDHGGRVDITDNSPRGAVVTFRIPSEVL